MFCFFNLSMITALEPVLCLPPSLSLLSLWFDCFQKVATTPRFCGSEMSRPVGSFVFAFLLKTRMGKSLRLSWCQGTPGPWGKSWEDLHRFLSSCVFCWFLTMQKSERNREHPPETGSDYLGWKEGGARGRGFLGTGNSLTYLVVMWILLTLSYTLVFCASFMYIVKFHNK